LPKPRHLLRLAPRPRGHGFPCLSAAASLSADRDHRDSEAWVDEEVGGNGGVIDWSIILARRLRTRTMPPKAGIAARTIPRPTPAFHGFFDCAISASRAARRLSEAALS